MNSRELKSVQIDRIAILTGRDLQPEVVRDIASSIDLIGLQLPVSVVDDGDEHFRVISGRHRLAAVRSLGRVEIDAMVYRGLSDTDVRLAEIVENLHRAELTQLQRAEQIADYRRLATEKRVGVSGQLGQKPQGGRPAGGDSEAARELGLNRKEVNRAGKIADINPAAKIAAKQAGLDDNQSALLEVATAPHDKQADVVVAIAARKNRAKLNKVAPSPRGKNVQQIVENILREFSESDVRLIVDGLSAGLISRETEKNSSLALATNDESQRSQEEELDSGFFDDFEFEPDPWTPSRPWEIDERASIYVILSLLLSPSSEFEKKLVAELASAKAELAGTEDKSIEQAQLLESIEVLNRAMFHIAKSNAEKQAAEGEAILANAAIDAEVHEELSFADRADEELDV